MAVRLTMIAGLMLLLLVVKADLSIYCESLEFPEYAATVRTFKQYEECEDKCVCYVFELLCVERGDKDAEGNYVFTLESTSYDQVQECAEENACICNY